MTTKRFVSATQSGFDDIKLDASAVPEPSTYLPAILGLLRLPGSELAEQTVAP